MGDERNKPCWCGSGRKFKRCHYGRETEAAPNLGELEAALRRSRTERCLHPDAQVGCAGGIVQAHTVQASLLRELAVDGHVYSSTPSLSQVFKSQGQPGLAKVGIRRASTFTGFCAEHDDALFAPIEKSPIRTTREHAFLLAYRALARELYLKDANVTLRSHLASLDRGKSLLDQVFLQGHAAAFSGGTELGARDLAHHKKALDVVLREGTYERVHATFVELDSPTPLMCSAGVFPEYDFAGRQLQRLDDPAVLDLVTLSVASTGGRGLVAFVWPEGSTAARRLIESFLSLAPADQPAALVRFVFEFVENVYVAPRWWEALPKDDQKSLENRLSAGASPIVARRAGCLLDDRLSLPLPAVSNTTNLW